MIRFTHRHIIAWECSVEEGVDFRRVLPWIFSVSLSV